MDKKAKFVFSNFQNVFLGIAPIAVIALIWGMLSINAFLKLCLCVLLYVGIFWAVIFFAEFLGYFSVIKTAKAAVLTTILVFVTFPLLITIMHAALKSDYLKFYPADNQIHVRISCDIVRTGGSGSIGSDWTYEHFLNDKQFNDGEVVIINAKNSFAIKSRFIEHDSIDDIGYASSKQYRYSPTDDLDKPLTISQKVHVVERGGKKYAGSTADFNVTYTLQRVFPESLSYWDVFFYTSDSSVYSCFIVFFVGLLLSIGLVVFVIIYGRKREAFANEQERLRKTQELEKERQRQEQKFLSDKAEFIKRLQGKTIRQVAGVPAHISFVNGLPTDDNNNKDAPYGSFTVYCSSSGICYHDKIGCCSARNPKHYFNAKKKYKPCSRCCTNRRSIPQWYTDYISLADKARYYGIDVPELATIKNVSKSIYYIE